MQHIARLQSHKTFRRCLLDEAVPNLSRFRIRRFLFGEAVPDLSRLRIRRCLIWEAVPEVSRLRIWCCLFGKAAPTFRRIVIHSFTLFLDLQLLKRKATQSFDTPGKIGLKRHSLTCNSTAVITSNVYCREEMQIATFRVCNCPSTKHTCSV